MSIEDIDRAVGLRAGGVSPPRARRWSRALLALGLASLSGCRNEMYDQARYEPMEASAFFKNGTSARPLVEGTIPQPPRAGGVGQFAPEMDSGFKYGKLVAAAPFPVDRRVLDRGQERYRIFCTPCHGELGDGNGIVVQRGFTRPPAFTSEELRGQPLGHFFEVMTRGYGAMYSYASRVPPRDRWAIAAYIRALQLSQHAVPSEIPADDRQRLEEATHGSAG